MLKPLILLVDDDRAVLDALDADLRPAFEEICRLETFDRTEDVLAAVPSWRADGRPIAVAIVDQKMPGTTGVELITSLRQGARADAAHPSAFMRAVLLTGYGGLDSALAGKNDAAIDRYVEKPWDPARLVEETSTLLGRYVRASGAGSYVVFREVRGPAEIREHLALRFRVYRTLGRTTHLVPGEGAGFDLDAYDAVSRHFGLFLEGEGTHLIGTLRVSGRETSPALRAIESLVADAPALEARWQEPREYPLPMMKYLIDREAVAALVRTIEATGERIVEPGRLAMAPEFHDVFGRAIRHLAPHIVESAVAFFFFFLDIQHAALTCVPSHVRFYRTVGFADAPGTERRLHPGFEVVVACLYARRDDVPEPARSRIMALAESVRRRGGACRCPVFPACVGGPYESGEFGEVDLFCPAATVQALRCNAGA